MNKLDLNPKLGKNLTHKNAQKKKIIIFPSYIHFAFGRILAVLYQHTKGLRHTLNLCKEYTPLNYRHKPEGLH